MSNNFELYGPIVVNALAGTRRFIDLGSMYWVINEIIPADFPTLESRILAPTVIQI